MPKFSPGDKVWYIPDHAEDASHPDVEIGVVESIQPTGVAEAFDHGDKPGYLVDYPNDGSLNTKLTYERNLEPRE